jgi:GT2 family glycosyltransferase
MVAVSVIVPTYRREAPLRRCVTGILGQRHPSFELLVVDQSPDHEPETWATLRALPAHARHVRLEQPSVTGACNTGVKLARAPIVVFLDDDVEIDDPDLLARHEACYAEASVGAVAGRMRHAGATRALPPPGLRGGALAFLDVNFDHDQALDVPTTCAANMSTRRELVERLGGFDERFTANAFRWETDYSVRVIRAGYRIRYLPDAAVVHHFGTPGGCENGHLLSHAPASHAWYETFFRNNVYFGLKLLAGADRARFLARLYREHALNRAYLAVGPAFLARRHGALARGARAGWRAWRAARAER